MYLKRDKINIRKLKNAYDEIPIPAELQIRVTAMIPTGDVNTAPPCRSDRRRPFHAACMQYVVLTIAILVSAMIVLPNFSYTAYAFMKDMPILGPVTKVFTVRTYEDNTGDMSASIATPKITAGSEALNEELSQYSEKAISAYRADIAASGAKVKESLNLSYSVVTDNSRLFALRFDKTISMADTAKTVKIYNINKQTGSIISLKDLFKSGADYRTVIAGEIKRQMQHADKKSGRSSYFQNYVDSAMKGDVDFYIDARGKLVIVFDAGEVAPMSMGICTFTIPRNILQNMIAAGSCL